MIPRIPTTARSFRIFRGSRRKGADMSDRAFLAELGNVFMPGTPLMLRDHGLAAYVPAVLPTPVDQAGLPDEMALIAYASVQRYERVRRETVVGRMYTHSHRGVFDMEQSGSLWPVPLSEALGVDGPVAAFFLDGRAWDWQADGTIVFWAGIGAASNQLRREVVEALSDVRDELAGAGVLECVGQVGPGWGGLWYLFDGHPADPLNAAHRLADLLAPLSHVTSSTAERRVWVDEPPVEPVVRGHAYSYIFTRDARHFLG